MRVQHLHKLTENLRGKVWLESQFTGSYGPKELKENQWYFVLSQHFYLIIDNKMHLFLKKKIMLIRDVFYKILRNKLTF